MALPIVTYGKYNYGQYANPTPIRYKGGFGEALTGAVQAISTCLLYTSPSPRDGLLSRMPSSA